MTRWAPPDRHLEIDLQDELERSDCLFKLVQHSKGNSAYTTTGPPNRETVVNPLDRLRRVHPSPPCPRYHSPRTNRTGNRCGFLRNRKKRDGLIHSRSDKKNMATKSETTGNLDIDPEEDERADKPSQRGIWVDVHRWKKLQMMKDELGNWNRFADIVVEQLLASGLICDEVRQEIYKINRDNGIDFLDDTSWRDAFKIREPWPETATNIRKIRENLEEIKAGLRELSQTVEDHATSMLEAELIKPDPNTDEADDT